MLEVRDLNVSYDETNVLWDINLMVNEGEVVSLVGSNGAGKTTLLRAIAGLIHPLAGEIMLDRSPITFLPTDEIVRRGISYIPEGRRLFAGMTVQDNLLVGAYTRRKREEVEVSLERAYNLFPILRERRSQLAGKLSGGEQQMCALARGLMARPRIMLIDELSLGLAPKIAEELFHIIKQINDEGVTILLVEQDVQAALEMACRGYVLEHGKIVLEGRASELLEREEIKAAYLGI